MGETGFVRFWWIGNGKQYGNEQTVATATAKYEYGNESDGNGQPTNGNGYATTRIDANGIWTNESNATTTTIATIWNESNGIWTDGNATTTTETNARNGNGQQYE